MIDYEDNGHLILAYFLAVRKIIEAGVTTRFTVDYESVLRCSICTGEQVLCAKDRNTGKLLELMLIGFPVWYYAAPNIIETFVKSYDFSGKRVALFATSGGSDITKAPGKHRDVAEKPCIERNE